MIEHIIKDRENRKKINNALNESKELSSVFTCDVCDNESSEGIVYEDCNMCLNCASKITNILEDFEYDLSNESSISVGSLVSMISEANITINNAKLEGDATSKYGSGDLMSDICTLIKSYGMKCTAGYNLSDYSKKGQIYFDNVELSSNSNRFNQFLIDYDGEFTTTKSASYLTPDGDGTRAVIKVKGSVVDPANLINTSISSTSGVNTKATTPVSKPAGSVNTVKKTITVNPTTTVSTGVTTGDVHKTNFKSGDMSVDITELSNNNGVVTYQISLNGNKVNTFDTTVTDKTTAKDLSDLVKADMISNPQTYFNAFYGNPKSIKMSKYGITELSIDNRSFEKNMTLKVERSSVLDSDRFTVNLKQMTDKVEFTKFFNEVVSGLILSKYPALVNFKSKVAGENIGLDIISIDKDTIKIGISGSVNSYTVDLDKKKIEGSSGNKYLDDIIKDNMHIMILGYPAKDGSEWSYDNNNNYYSITDKDKNEIRACIDTDLLGTLSCPKVKVEVVDYAGSKCLVGTFDITSHRINVTKRVREIANKYLTDLVKTSKDLSDKKTEMMNSRSKKNALMRQLGYDIKKRLGTIKLDGSTFESFTVSPNIESSRSGEITKFEIIIEIENDDGDVKLLSSKLKSQFDKEMSILFSGIKDSKDATKSSDLVRLCYTITDNIKKDAITALKLDESFIAECFTEKMVFSI